MSLLPPMSTRPDPLFPSTTLFRSPPLAWRFPHRRERPPYAAPDCPCRALRLHRRADHVAQLAGRSAVGRLFHQRVLEPGDRGWASLWRIASGAVVRRRHAAGHSSGGDVAGPWVIAPARLYSTSPRLAPFPLPWWRGPASEARWLGEE